jgi:NAD(P)-dependent dehydrogenase (short-subunit alcohol dehydrogenase family)
MRALITGSTSGIGLAIARALRADGFDICLHGRDIEALHKLQSQLGAWRAYAADLTDPGEVKDFAELAAGWDIDILINNAGDLRSAGHSTLAAKRAEFERQMAFVWAALELSQAVIPGMLERGFGRLVHISSEVALNIQAAHRAGPYTLAKLATIGLGKLLDADLPDTDVTSNVALVGPTHTGTVEDLAGQLGVDMNTALAVMYPGMNRYATPDEVASVVAFLVSDPGARLFRGAVVPCHGGAIRGGI